MFDTLYMIERGVGDFAKSLDWYARFIGRKPSFMDAPNFYAHFELNQIRLAIKGVISPRSNDLLHFQVPDLLAEERRLHKIGILPTSPWKESDEGYRRLIYCDPDGQPICVFDWIVRSPGWDI